MEKLTLAQLEQSTTIPAGSLHLVEMGDGSGTKTVTQETLVKETGEALKVGNLEELQTEDKTSIVKAINEAMQSGGGAAVDILDSKEEIEANTEAGKVAGAAAVKEMFGELTDKLMFPDGEMFYPDVQNGVRGYNTDAARGADTFHPFSNSKMLLLGIGNIIATKSDLVDVDLNETKECDSTYFDSISNGFKCKKDCTCKILMASTATFASDTYHYTCNFYIYHNDEMRLKTSRHSQGISLPGIIELTLKKDDTIIFKSDGYAQNALCAKGFIVIGLSM